MNPSRDPRLEDLIMALPRLTETDVDLDAVCPICLVTLGAHLAEEDMASVMASPAQDTADLGVTRLQETCHHVFCRKDITVWIRQGQNVGCPTCRAPLLSQDRLATPSNSTAELGATNDMLNQLVHNVLVHLRPDSAQYHSIRSLLETALPGVPLPDNMEAAEQERAGEQQEQQAQEEQGSSPTREDFAGMYT